MTSHPTPAKGALRVCRGVGLSVVSALLAITAHGVAGGGMPDTLPTLLFALGISAAGVALANKRYSLSTVVVLLGITQLFTHLLMSVGSNDMPGMAMASSMEMPETRYNGLAMIGAHAVAVLITSLLVVRADAILFALAATLRRLLPVLVVPAPVPARPHSPRPTVAPCRPLDMVALCRINARRGPPVEA